MVKIGQVFTETNKFKDYTILYMYIAKEQGQVISGDKSLIVTKRLCYFAHTL